MLRFSLSAPRPEPGIQVFRTLPGPAVVARPASGRHLFDPTRKAVPDGLVRIGIGRDAAEVAFATPFGAFDDDKPGVWIEAKGAPMSEITTHAVRAEL